MMLGPLVVAAALASASTSALDKCRALDKEFDTKNMPKPCQAAADDATLGIPERVEALRRLAFAHILNGDESLAEPAFLKMLVFSPNVELPADAGPRFREIFNQVKNRFATEGALAVSFTAQTPIGNDALRVQVDVGDKLGRVVGARIKSVVTALGGAGGAGDGGAPVEDRLVRQELGPGQVRFSGHVPEPKDAPGPSGRHVAYDVVLDGWDGQPIPVPTAQLHGDYTRGIAAPKVVDGGGGGGEGGGFPWLWVGVGSAATVLVAGGITGGVIYCYTSGPCRTQDAWVRVQIHQEPQ